MSSPSLTQEYDSEYNSNNTNINDEFTYIILSPNVTVRKISEEDILKIYGYDGDDVDDKPKQKTKKRKSKKRKSKKPVIDITEAKDNEIIKIADEPVILDEDDSDIDTNNSSEETTNQEDATMYTQQPTDNDLHNLSINDGDFDVLERFRNISHIISVVKDTVYEEFTRIIVNGQHINSSMNRCIFLLSGFSQTSLGIIREINSNGLTNKKYFYVNRLHSIEDLLRPIIDTYTLLLDRKMNDPSRANIYPYYIQLQSHIISNNRFNIDLYLTNDIECSTYDCSICLNIKKHETKCTTSCSHDFCGDCIISHINHTELNNVCCPLCRQHITSIDVSTDNQLSRLLLYCK